MKAQKKAEQEAEEQAAQDAALPEDRMMSDLAATLWVITNMAVEIAGELKKI